MKKTILTPVALLVSIFFIQNVSAEMYKWTDKDGKTQYTQTPPPANIKSKDIEDDIKLSTGKLGDTAPAPEKKPDQDEMAAAKEAGAKSEQKHHDFCDEQADLLKQMTANSLVKWKDAKGEQILTADEKAAKMKDIQNNLDTLCQPKMFNSKDKGNDKTSQTEQAADARFSTDNTALNQGSGATTEKDAVVDNNDSATGAAALVPSTN